MGNLLEIVSEIEELRNISEFLEDEQIDKAMDKVVQLAVNPSAATDSPARTIVGLQALASSFAIKAAYYKTLDTGRANTTEGKKKQLYFTMADAINRLVDALKYMLKS